MSHENEFVFLTYFSMLNSNTLLGLLYHPVIVLWELLKFNFREFRFFCHVTSMF